MKPAMLIILVLGTVTFAADEPKATELDGTYALKSMSKGGMAAPEDLFKDIKKIVIKGDQFQIHFTDETKSPTIKINPSAMPATIDLKPSEGPNKDTTVLGIYKIEKETVTFCFGDEKGSARPTEFKSTAENKAMLMVLTKTK